MTWRYAYASVIGTSHARTATDCQDFSLCRTLSTPTQGTALVAVAADGAGSAVCAQQGAELACLLFQDEIAELFAGGGELSQITRPFLSEWLTRFQNAIQARAEAAGLQTRDFACTLLGAILTDDAGVFVQVGDGAMVVACQDDPDDYAWIFWPDKGEYANVTTFATQEEAQEQFCYNYRPETFTEIALFTDGLERLALHFQTNTAHNPFFRAMFAPMRDLEDGYSMPMSERLASFLNSPQVNGRTDDDKTLILATRRVVASPTETEPSDLDG